MFPAFQICLRQLVFQFFCEMQILSQSFYFFLENKSFDLSRAFFVFKPNEGIDLGSFLKNAPKNLKFCPRPAFQDICMDFLF